LNLWDFALAAWTRPGVEAACLALQDGYGQCVPLLLWRAWAAAEGRPVESPAPAIALARAWDNQIIAPMRGVRRALKADVYGAEGQAVSEKARATELAAERALLEGLEALTPVASGEAEDLSEALLAVAHLWSGTWPSAAVRGLASALG
jgi:uncharacterized protein (TIGR02444 family)